MENGPLSFITLPAGPIVMAFEAKVDFDAAPALPGRRRPRNLPSGATEAMFAGVRRSKKSGRATLHLIDTICCDFLGINPTELYGWEFLTVGTDAA